MAFMLSLCLQSLPPKKLPPLQARTPPPPPTHAPTCVWLCSGVLPDRLGRKPSTPLRLSTSTVKEVLPVSAARVSTL
jgi:hypothetical protein